MDLKCEISRLRRYLKIKDDETLVVPLYNAGKNKDEYILSRIQKSELLIWKVAEAPSYSSETPFVIFQHIGKNGKHEIPSVDKLQKEQDEDY